MVQVWRRGNDDFYCSPRKLHNCAVNGGFIAQSEMDVV